MSQFFRRLAKLKGPASTRDSDPGRGGGPSIENGPVVKVRSLESFTRLHLIEDAESKDSYRYHLHPMTPALFHFCAEDRDDTEEHSESAESMKQFMLSRISVPEEIRFEVSRCMRISGEQTGNDSQFWIEFPDGDSGGAGVVVVTVLLTVDSINATCDMYVPFMDHIPDEPKTSKESPNKTGVWRPGESSVAGGVDDGARPPYTENEERLPSYSDIHIGSGYPQLQAESSAATAAVSSSKAALMFSPTQQLPPPLSYPETGPSKHQLSTSIQQKHAVPELEHVTFTWEQVSPLARFKLFSSSKSMYDRTNILLAEFILETSRKNIEQGIKGQLIFRKGYGSEWERWVLCTLGILVNARG
ncbi:uncharacterized protein BP5553_07198 [Venustampulla echinocandica]|uniref:Uncharacterized protein n=1 Tax=Venustampulla echinocandica TaxID=2656787 RepID=A0A370TIT3_9HELO|nr:uncharacterized protein BP5553_07198 [Venustampulla echinocandica]RDL35267.1 hypothetical protein BP5553_07198 [Venustampulla echinocandica]